MNYAIIVGAGKGKRMGSPENKVFLLLNKPVIVHALEAFQKCAGIDNMIVVAQKNDFSRIEEIKGKYKLSKIRGIVEGGKERQDSVKNGLLSIKGAKGDDIVVIHNGSNPLVKEKEIMECIRAAKQHGAAVAGFPLKDTIKRAGNGFVKSTLDRKGIYQAQTPQAAKYGIFMEAFKNAEKKKLKATDDASLIEAIGKKVKIVQCSYENFKITTQEDLKIAKGILKKQDSFRIGFGHDSHRFSANRSRKLVLGGYIVPNEIGLEANSDGDLILHAIFNAISSAIGMKSLGHYADPMFEKGTTDSRQYLKEILNKLNEKGLAINNASISIEARKPRLDDHTDNIIGSLSKILLIEKERIGLTYTTGEGLTSFGRGEGMQCFCAVSIMSG